MIGRNRRVWLSFGLYLCGVIQADAKDVQCVLNDSTSNHDGQAALCICYKVKVPPWDDDDVVPAPKPYNISARFDVKKKNIHARVSWSQKADHLEHLDGGYFLEIMVSKDTVHPDYPLNYNCNVDTTRLMEEKNNALFTFHFDDSFRDDPMSIEPGNEVYFKIYARPMYNIEDTPGYVDIEIKAPACGDNKYSRTRYCEKRARDRGKRKKKLHRDRKRKQHKCLYKDDPTTVASIVNEKEGTPVHQFVLVAVGTAFVCITAMVLAALCKTRRSPKSFCGSRVGSSQKNRVFKKHRVLVIGDDDDERYIPFINTLVETIREHGDSETEVIANIRRASEVGKEGVIRWTTEKIKEVDVVIFVIKDPCQIKFDRTENEERGSKWSHVRIGLEAAQSVAGKLGFSASKAKFVLLDICNFANEDSLLFCARYTFSKDFKELLKHALATRYQDTSFEKFVDNHKLLVKLLPKVERVSIFSRTGTKKKCNSFQPNSSTDLNNLDDSLAFQSADNDKSLMEPNIMQDQYPSVESNTAN